MIYPSPVHVSYATVRTLVPQLWDPAHYGGKRVDYMVHIGMAAPRSYYSLERMAHRDGYMMGDADGVVLGDELGREEERRRRRGGVSTGCHGRTDKEEQMENHARQKPREGATIQIGARDTSQDAEDDEEWCWADCPEKLTTHIDVDDVWQRWRIALPDTDLRISNDAGHYLCDFIYFSSLAHLWKAGAERRVVFLHVPGATDEEAVRRGVDVTVELIRGMVESGMRSRRVGALRM